MAVPVRVCDVGGWTDTWFAGGGRVCSLAVGPGVTVEATATPGGGGVTIEAVDYDVVFTLGSEPPQHRLLAEAAREAGATDDRDVRVRVSSALPPATSVGTSASVCVGIIAALDALGGAVRSPAELAAAAHRAEADRLGRQSGVQDQVAAAHGGANLIEIDPYPRATVRAVAVPEPFRQELDDRLVHVAYGPPHDSSAVHDGVIAALTDEGPSSPRLQHLRDLAREAELALAAGDLDAYGRVLTANTDAQDGLHPGLVAPEARELIALARSAGAVGWKVNGAGGRGGSLSILCRDATGRARLVDAVRHHGHRPLPLSLAWQGAHVVRP